MASAAEAAAAGEFGYLLRCGAGFEVAVLVRDTHNAVGVSDVNPLRVGTGGIEGHAEGEVEFLREDGGLFWLAVGTDAAKELDLAGLAFREEEIAVGREAQQTRIVEPGRIHIDLEAPRCDGPGIRRARDDCGAVVDRLLGLGLGKVSDGDMTAGAGGLVERVGEGGLAGEDGVIG